MDCICLRIFYAELLIRLELTDADAPVGLYLHSTPNPSFVKGGALEVVSTTLNKMQNEGFNHKAKPFALSC